MNVPSNNITDSLTTLLSEGNNHPEIKLQTDPTITTEGYKYYEEKKNKEYLQYDENHLKELFDIIVIIGPQETDLTYLNDWKPLIENIHVIIIQQGNPNRQINVPDWLEFELYNKKDIDRSFTKLSIGLSKPPHNIDTNPFSTKLTGVSPMFDLTKDTWTAVNFAMLVADRDFIYLLDRHMKPVFRPDRNPLELLRLHAMNLLKPTSSGGGYYNYGYDAFHRHFDYWKGVPYSLRDGLESVLSIGTTFHDSQQDTMTRVVKTASNKVADKLSRKSGGNVNRRQLLRGNPKEITEGEQVNLLHQVEDNIRVDSIPKGVSFSLSLQNIAINRKVIGSYFFLVSGLENSPSLQADNLANIQFGEEYYHILLGWMLKRIFDYVGYGVKHFDSTTYLQPYTSNNNPSQVLNEEEKKDSLAIGLRQDLLWLQLNEVWYQTIVNFTPTPPSPPPSSSPTTPSQPSKEPAAVTQLFFDLIKQLKEISSPLITDSTLQLTNTQLFTEMEKMLSDYSKLWQYRHNYQTLFLPVSSRSTFAPEPSSSHTCAVFTITYNDIEMLSIWIRYFTRHFPSQDVYILNHHSSAVQDPIRNQEYEKTLQQLEEKYKIRIIDLYGEKTGFPMMFFIRTADLFQRRLYRYGYQCTILTDTDELLLADPQAYPDGLKQYLTQFAPDQSKTALRGHGHIIGQLSTIIHTPEKMSNIRPDQPLDWNQDIFSQRRYWTIQPLYSKPALSRIPVRHYPGFHNLYYPKPTKLDPKLILLHLRDMDAKQCEQREYMKAMIVQNTSFKSELDKGLSTHLVHYQEKLAKGEVCQYSYCKYYMKNHTVYDNTMDFIMKKIPERFRKIQI